MTKLGFVIANVRGRPLRTALAIASFTIASIMFVSTWTLVERSHVKLDATARERIIVMPNGEWSIPLAHVEAIKHLPGVLDVDYERFLSGHDPREPSSTYFVWGATDGWPASQPSSTLKISPAIEAAWRADRMGLVATKVIADRLGWRVGGPVTVVLFDGATLQANFTGYVEGVARVAILHFDHATRALPDSAELTRLSVACEPSRCKELINSIDRLFESGSFSTFSMTQEAFFDSLQRNSSHSSIPDLFALVGIVVISVIALVMASSLAIAFRERTAEFASLRAIGFPRSSVFGLLLVESLVPAAIGGVLGSIPVFLYTSWHAISFSPEPGWELLNDLAVSPTTMLGGIGLALGLGVFVCLFPAITSLRQSIVEGLGD